MFFSLKNELRLFKLCFKGRCFNSLLPNIYFLVWQSGMTICVQKSFSESEQTLNHFSASFVLDTGPESPCRDNVSASLSVDLEKASWWETWMRGWNYPPLLHWKDVPRISLRYLFIGKFFFPTERATSAASKLSFLSLPSCLSSLFCLFSASFLPPSSLPGWDQWRGGKGNWCLLSTLCAPDMHLPNVFSPGPWWQTALGKVLFPPLLWMRMLRLVIKEIAQKYAI